MRSSVHPILGPCGLNSRSSGSPTFVHPKSIAFFGIPPCCCRACPAFEAKIDRKIDVQYCGIPTHEFYKIDTNKSEFTIGGLYTLRETKRFDYLRAVMDQVKAKYVFFGNGKSGPGEYCCKPSMIEKRRLYSKCDVWISTSSHEGLHIPPMEAALCGATIVANSKESAGNMDYCKDGKTCMMFDDGKIDQIIAAVNELRDNPDKRADLNHNMRSLIENKIGDVDANAKLIVEKLNALGIR